VAHTIERSPAPLARGSEAPDPLPRDYGAINAVYATLLAGVLVATRGRLRREDQISTAELMPLGAATFALSKVVARERIGAWMREPFVDDPVHPRRPRGRRFRRALGELVMCTRCVGAWSALGLVGLRVVSPEAGRTVTAVLATSATNDFLQAAFKALCGVANETERPSGRSST
jgi:Protein of unknown function (DUF1360)